MKIYVYTHDQYSHVSGAKYFINKLNLKNDVTVFVDSKFRNVLNDIDNINIVEYSSNIERKLRKVTKDYSKYSGAIGTVRDISSIDKMIDEACTMCEFFIRASFEYCDELEKYIFDNGKPDLIIRDCCSLYARIIAEKQNIKVMGYTTSPTVTEGQILENKRKYLELIFNFMLKNYSDKDVETLYSGIKNGFEMICKKYDIKSIPIAYLVDPGEEINFSYGLDIRKNIDKNKYYYFKPELFEKNDDIEFCKNKIYISAGSTVTFPIDIYNYIVNAVRKFPFQSTITFKYYDGNIVTFNDLPKNIKFTKFANQIEELKRSKLFITHGGYNSLLESIYYEVPMIVIPLSNDQFYNAEFIKMMKIGYSLDRESLYSSQPIFNLILEIIKNEKTYNKKLKELKNDFFNLDDIDNLNNIVSSFIDI